MHTFSRSLPFLLATACLSMVATSLAFASAEEDARPLERSLSLMTKAVGLSEQEYRKMYGGDGPVPGYAFVKKTTPYTRRYSRNYVVRVVGPETPDFYSITEFARTPGSWEKINELVRVDDRAHMDPWPRPYVRTTMFSFTEKLLFGKPVDDCNPGREMVKKRGIFLRRATDAPAEVLEKELSGFTNDLAKRLAPSIDRMMTYTRTSDMKNYPTLYYPGKQKVQRYFDKIIMLWPKEGSALPETFEVPSPYTVYTVLDFESDYTPIKVACQR